MPTWPTKEGRTTITLELRTELVEHLDAQAEYLGQSRAAYVRGLVMRDMERQGPGRAGNQR
jgi:predicted DNA-binding protein